MEDIIREKIKRIEKEIETQRIRQENLEKELYDLRNDLNVRLIEVKSDISKNTEITSQTNEILMKNDNHKNKLIYIMLLAILLFAGLKITEFLKIIL